MWLKFWSFFKNIIIQREQVVAAASGGSSSNGAPKIAQGQRQRRAVSDGAQAA